MISLLLATALAADPAALRQIDGEGLLIDVSSEAVGIGVARHDLRLAASYAYGSHVALHVGTLRPLVGAERTWGVDAVLAGGAAALLATPGVALVATGELRAGARGDDGQATLGLVTPLALRLDLPPELAVPLALELRFAVRLGPLWLGTRGQAGATFVPGQPPAMRTAGSVFVQLIPGD